MLISRFSFHIDLTLTVCYGYRKWPPKYAKSINVIIFLKVELLPAASSTKTSEQSNSRSDDSSESDSTDSEDSEISGLEEEEEGTTSDTVSSEVLKCF